MIDLVTRESNGEICIHQKGHGCFAVIPLGDYSWFTDQARANAQLISAAPDMLNALKNIENDDNHIPAKIWSLIQSAISKAEGKEVL